MDPLDLRAEIPALADATYCNFGAHGPSPRRVVEAATAATERQEYDAGAADPYETAFDAYDRARERVAGLLGADPGEVALTDSTGDGIARIASAFDWGPDDAVVITDLEHPAGVLPWRHLERRGVTVRVVETEGGRIDRDAFAEAVAGATLACFSAVTWTHGTRLPVRDLVEIARDAGAFTLVDAVQVPGHLPMDVREWGADAVAAAGHKWLLGPWSAGFLYVREERAANLVPGSVGYRSVEDPDAADPVLAEGARRFELGTTSPAPYAGLVEAIDAIEAVGVGAIADRIERLTDRLKDRVGERLLSPREFHSGLVTVDAADPERVVEELAEEGIVVRSLPDPEAVRASVHAVSTAADVDAVAEALGPR